MFSVMFALETAARKPAIIRSSNSRSPLPVRIIGIRYPDTSLSRSDGYEHLTTAKFTISSVNGKIWLCTKMAERRGCDVTCNRSIEDLYEVEKRVQVERVERPIDNFVQLGIFNPQV